MAANARRIEGADAPLQLLNTLECGTVVGFNVGPGRVNHLPARNNDNVDPSQWFVGPEQLPNEPFGSISGDGVSDFLAGGDAEPGRTDVISQGETGHEAASQTGAALVDSGELRPSPQFHRDDVTDKRFRPLARRRLSTIRPFFDFILTRKP